MTPERVLKALAHEIHTEIAMLETKGQVELMAGDFAAYEKTKELLMKVAAAVGIGLEKYQAFN